MPCDRMRATSQTFTVKYAWYASSSDTVEAVKSWEYSEDRANSTAENHNRLSPSSQHTDHTHQCKHHGLWVALPVQQTNDSCRKMPMGQIVGLGNLSSDYGAQSGRQDLSRTICRPCVCVYGRRLESRGTAYGPNGKRGSAFRLQRQIRDIASEY